MNYSKSLSELLFEDHENNELVVERKKKKGDRRRAKERAQKKGAKRADRKKQNKAKKALSKDDAPVIQIRGISSAAFLALPEVELQAFASMLFRGPANLKSKLIEYQKNAASLSGQQGGDENTDAGFTEIKNSIAKNADDKLYKSLEKSDNELNTQIANIIQGTNTTLPKIGPVRFDFLNVGKEDKTKSQDRDIKMFDRLGHAFFTIVDPKTNNKVKIKNSKDVDQVIVFVLPIKKYLNKFQSDIYLTLFNSQEIKLDNSNKEQGVSNESASLRFEGEMIHESSLSSLLFETNVASGTGEHSIFDESVIDSAELESSLESAASDKANSLTEYASDVDEFINKLNKLDKSKIAVISDGDIKLYYIKNKGFISDNSDASKTLLKSVINQSLEIKSNMTIDFIGVQSNEDLNRSLTRNHINDGTRLDDFNSYYLAKSTPNSALNIRFYSKKDLDYYIKLDPGVFSTYTTGEIVNKDVVDKEISLVLVTEKQDSNFYGKTNQPLADAIKEIFKNNLDRQSAANKLNNVTPSPRKQEKPSDQSTQEKVEKIVQSVQDGNIESVTQELPSLSSDEVAQLGKSLSDEDLSNVIQNVDDKSRTQVFQSLNLPQDRAREVIKAANLPDEQTQELESLEDEQREEAEKNLTIDDHISNVFDYTVNTIKKNRVTLRDRAYDLYKEDNSSIENFSEEQLFCLALKPDAAIKYRKELGEKTPTEQMLKLVEIYENQYLASDHSKEQYDLYLKIKNFNNTNKNSHSTEKLLALLLLLAWLSKGEDQILVPDPDKGQYGDHPNVLPLSMSMFIDGLLDDGDFEDSFKKSKEKEASLDVIERVTQDLKSNDPLKAAEELESLSDEQIKQVTEQFSSEDIGEILKNAGNENLTQAMQSLGLTQDQASAALQSAGVSAEDIEAALQDAFGGEESEEQSEEPPEEPSQQDKSKALQGNITEIDMLFNADLFVSNMLVPKDPRRLPTLIPVKIYLKKDDKIFTLETKLFKNKSGIINLERASVQSGDPNAIKELQKESFVYQQGLSLLIEISDLERNLDKEKFNNYLSHHGFEFVSAKIENLEKHTEGSIVFNTAAYINQFDGNTTYKAKLNIEKLGLKQEDADKLKGADKLRVVRKGPDLSVTFEDDRGEALTDLESFNPAVSSSPLSSETLNKIMQDSEFKRQSKTIDTPAEASDSKEKVELSEEDKQKVELFTEKFKKTEKLTGENKEAELIERYEATLDTMMNSIAAMVFQQRTQMAQEEASQIAYQARQDSMDTSVLSGLATMPALIGAAIAMPTLATGGAALLAAPIAASLFGNYMGKKSLEKNLKKGPQQTNLESDVRKGKDQIKKIILDISRDILGIEEKEEQGSSQKTKTQETSPEESTTESFIYRQGLSLLIEDLKEELIHDKGLRFLFEEEEEGKEASSEKSKDTKDSTEGDEKESKPETEQDTRNIRAKVNWATISSKLEAKNFFAYESTFKVGNPGLFARVEKELSVKVGALMADCFGIKVTDVEQISLRAMQAETLAGLIVDPNAKQGHGSINGAQPRGSSAKGRGDLLDLDSFTTLLNEMEGDVSKVIMYLLANGKLNSIFDAGGRSGQTVQEVMDVLVKTIKGEMSDMPSSLASDAEEAIRKINSNDWIDKLLRRARHDSPIRVIYTDLKKDDLLPLVEKVESLLVQFSDGWEDPIKATSVTENISNYTIGKHSCSISKRWKDKEGNDQSSYFRFVTGKENARRLIFDKVVFINDESSFRGNDNFKIFIGDEINVLNEIETDPGIYNVNSAEEFAKPLAAAIIIKAMRAAKAGSYHEDFKLPTSSENIIGKDYARAVVKVFLGEEITYNDVPSDVPPRQSESIRSTNREMISRAFRKYIENITISSETSETGEEAGGPGEEAGGPETQTSSHKRREDLEDLFDAKKIHDDLLSLWQIR